MNSIDVGRAVKAPFEDPQWVSKTLMGFLWMLLGVTIPAVYGAHLDYVKSVSEGREELPPWDDFGGKWVKGFMLVLAYFIYLLPIWILFFILVLPGILTAVGSGGDFGGGLLGGGICLFSIVSLIYGVAIAVLMYGATVNYAMKGDFGSLFAFSEILAHVRDGSGYFTAWVWALVIGLGSSVVVSVLSATFVGYILVPAIAYLQLMMTAHVFGQWAAKSYRVAPAAVVAAAVPGAPAGYIPPTPPAPPAPPATPPAPPAPVEPPATPAPPAPPVEPAPMPPSEPAPPMTPPMPPSEPEVFEPPAPPAPPVPETPPAEKPEEGPSS